MQDAQETLVGIDVSARTLSLCLEKPEGKAQAFELSNTPSGHQKLIQRLSGRNRTARIVLEATGIYHFDLALALHRASGIEVMVLNPRVARDFAKASRKRAKTDAVDADVLLEFARRMPLRAGQPPAKEVLELRDIARRIGSLNKIRTQEKNRLHARCAELSPAVRNDLEVNIRHLKRRLVRLQAEALDLVNQNPTLRRQFAHLTSIKGIAQASAIQILSELCGLPKSMTPRQWVAQAGLDPRPFESGHSVRVPTRISRVGNSRLRAALYLPSLVAIHHEPNVAAFYEKLVAKGKAKMQAIVAVMRKLLHAIYGMLRTGTDFDGNKFHVIAQ